MSEAMMDSITLLIERRLIGLSLQESAFAPFYAERCFLISKQTAEDLEQMRG